MTLRMIATGSFGLVLALVWAMAFARYLQPSSGDSQLAALPTGGL